MALRSLITGASGRLGVEVVRYFPEAFTPTHEELDIRDYGQVARIFEKARPELVIHLAGLADVRACEESKALAWEVNVIGTANIVKMCGKSDAHPLLLYPSTPCVFPCDKGGYTESSIASPVNYYGQTKAAAERVVLGYDNALVFRKNFVPRARWRYPKAFVDRFGTYLFADELAFIISQLPGAGFRGIVHIVGKERLSMYELAMITTPDVVKTTLEEADLRLCADMSLSSELLPSFPMTKKAERPQSYDAYRLKGF
jgi:dTDP-4-dehydrorhamnose reductase